MKNILNRILIAAACMAILMVSFALIVTLMYFVSLCKFDNAINVFVCLPIVTFIAALFAAMCSNGVYNLSIKF
jgi:hypothetical protein